MISLNNILSCTPRHLGLLNSDYSTKIRMHVSSAQCTPHSVLATIMYTKCKLFTMFQRMAG